MNTLREMWRRVASARQKRALESEIARLHAENARLREENRALLNSILGIAGIPPVFLPPQNAGVLGTTNSAEMPRTDPSSQPGPETPAFGPVSPLSDAVAPTSAATGGRGKKVAQIAAPVRKRSWQQINRALEFEAARRKSSETDGNRNTRTALDS